nr:hypothetical protein [Acinetobacter sp. Marseille-Q1620]
MFVSLGYTLKDGVEIIVKGYILHPHNLHETWIVFKDILLIDLYSEAHYRSISEINLERVLEHLYNKHLPGLHVPSTHVYYIDRNDQYFHVSFNHKRKKLLNPRDIKVTKHSVKPITDDEFHLQRIDQAKALMAKLV